MPIAIDINPSEEYIVLALENNNIGKLSVKSIGLNEDLTKPIQFELVGRGFHSGPISAADIAYQRPLLVTCSREDSTVRLWNYETGLCELAREYYVFDD